ncbi:hypothetical protein QE441_000066 [Chryseobacterium sp. SORGH_AS909]|uniref:Uncharacterized protein n=1 Tax=Chryseobacterium camelliae TaxID=1265445 RepID=A0ABU0TKZ3_9FLAO|nr:hypothetical protein [Chryseobacterium camelliae]MDQ1100830.1 hypothetical protein [Chryseobacterium sp. SORGH_AS_1048]MDR6084272.1 hypothetical protein [Chryseobacterium sp. SORGH_AS_0909]MDR6132544.1 hypothetical protein [Chryseobacterium sp. SORGH_AS_1175]MDT3409249.1 hypothetical protein [Pseudacidovorax intermedius]
MCTYSLQFTQIPAAKFHSLGGVAKIQRIFDGVVFNKD